MSFIYVASPYTGTIEQMEVRFLEVEHYVAHMLQQGVPVFSPIVHCHSLAHKYDLPKEVEFWDAYDKRMMDAATELHVLCLRDWESSRGVRMEIGYMMAQDKIVNYIRMNGSRYEYVHVD